MVVPLLMLLMLMYIKHLFTYLLRCVSLCMCKYAYVCSCVQYCTHLENKDNTQEPVPYFHLVDSED